MERILTKREYKFVTEFIELMDKYSVLFSTNEKGHIEIIVQENYGDVVDNEFLNPFLELKDCFDHNELLDVLKQTDERIKQIALDYLPKDLFDKYVSQQQEKGFLKTLDI